MQQIAGYRIYTGTKIRAKKTFVRGTGVEEIEVVEGFQAREGRSPEEQWLDVVGAVGIVYTFISVRKAQSLCQRIEPPS